MPSDAIIEIASIKSDSEGHGEWSLRAIEEGETSHDQRQQPMKRWRCGMSRRRISFGTELALSVGILTLLMVGAMALVAWFTSSSLLTGEIETRLAAIAEVREEHTSLYINNTFTALHLISSRLILQDYVKRFHEGIPLTFEEMRYGNEDITSSIASYRGVYIAEILSINGSTVFKNEKEGFKDFFLAYPDMPMYQGSRGKISDPYPISIKTDTNEAFVFSIDFEDASGIHEQLGTLRLLISTDELYGILSGRAGLQDSRGQVVLTRPDVASDTFRFILQPAHDPIYGPVPIPLYECIPEVMNLAPEDPTKDSECTSYNGIEVAIAARAVRSLPDWKLMAEMPMFVVQRPIDRLRNFLLIGIFINLFLALLLSAVWARRAVRPLRALRQTAYSFSHGDFTVRAGHHARFWRNEIAELSEAFNEMAVDLHGMYRNLEQKVLDRTQALEVANNAKSAFLASISHEIRTPLNGIIGLASLLLDTKLDDDQYDMTRSIRDCGEGLLTIVNDVLDFSKIEAGKLTLELRSVDLRHVLQVCVYLLKPKADAKGVLLDYTMESDVPSFILADSVRLQQILLNLMGNAVKFTEKGHVRTLVRADLNRKKLDFEVEDTGIGIPRDAVGKLFQSFSQVDNSITRRYGGTGLGLAISKKLVELFGGTLGVRSVEGSGSVFFFDVPLIPANETANEQGIKDPSEVSSTMHEGESFDNVSVAILLAEDNAVNVKVVTAMLRKLQLRNIDVVDNGLSATEAVRLKRYDIVLMDMQMPIMGGLEATKVIREMKGEVHQPVIVALTANAMEGDYQRCIESGMDDYLTKPINQKTLKMCLNRHVTSLELRDTPTHEPPDS